MRKTSLVFEPTSGPVARALIGAGAYRLAEDMTAKETWFKWKSDVVAPVYTDCRVVAGDTGATGIVVTALGTAIRAYHPAVERVVGVAEAGLVWSSAVAYEMGLPHAFVRKERKRHGTSALVECPPPAGRRVVVIDDLVASGKSMGDALRALATECRAEVLGVLSIVNWHMPAMRERFSRIGVPYHALVSYPHLLQAAVEAGQLTRVAAKELQRFYRNPQGHSWDLEALSDARRTG